jgi:hypothetical protein
MSRIRVFGINIAGFIIIITRNRNSGKNSSLMFYNLLRT